eukprot:gene15614-18553_t
MAELYSTAQPLYFDKKSGFTYDEFKVAIEKSTTVYVGFLSFYTTEEQLYELFSKCGEIKKIIMGLDRLQKTPCGFCFVEYYSKEDAADCIKYINGTKLDERLIRCDWDYGFKEGRQYGRGMSGGQVRDEYRTDYDPGRGGYGKQKLIELEHVVEFDPQPEAYVGKRGDRAVVVSAMEGITNTLIRMTLLAKSQDTDGYEATRDSMLSKLLECAKTLIPKQFDEFERGVRSDVSRIVEVLRAIAITQSINEEMEDLIVGHGEVWSAQLLAAYLKEAGVNGGVWLDTRKTLFVSKGGECGPVVDWKRSETALGEWMASNFTQDLDILIITGFIASSLKGMPTTLQRNGSDYSASIFGAMLKSRLITIWKDVDGLFSADPKIVPKATILKEISYQEVSELSYYGANILHPHTMPPAISNNIPIRIRNFFNLSNNGSLISNDTDSIYNVKGFSAIRRVSLINVEGAGLGVSNLAQRVFLALRDVKVSVLLISQGSSQSSICIALTEKDGDISLEAIKKEFYNEITYTGHIQTIELVRDCSIIAAVGDKMVSSIGVASKLFSALTKSGVNIKAIAQGSSERNISAVLKDKDTSLALKAVHSTFYRPFDPDVISVGIIGTGLIGSELLELLKAPMPQSNRPKHNFVVRAISNSKKSVLSQDGVTLDNWKALLESSNELCDFERFGDFISNGYPRHSVIIDCSANHSIPKHYTQWMAKGIHIITPNKVGFSGPYSLYKEIHQVAEKHFTHCLYETTVGGGLPIIHMIQQMVSIGDKITKIEGIFSGTLSYIFNTFSSTTQKYSDIVLAAKSKGFTEPDPRDDLNGMDFARKIVILAREIGLEIELTDVNVVSLIPADNQEAVNSNVQEFLVKHLPSFDEKMEAMKREATSNNSLLRYSGVIDIDWSSGVPKAVASVSLRSYSNSHAFASLSECDNIVAIQSQRYNKTPLVIQGPGAGATVTAAGIYGDLYRLSSYLQHV